MSKHICVYAASSDHLSSVYVDAAQQLGTLMAQRGHTLVYGAGNNGLMGTIAQAVHNHGGKIIGIIPEKLLELEVVYEEADEIIITADMRERKRLMEERADAFIAIPGGFGTLEEISEILTAKQLAFYDRPLVFLNINGVYNDLLRFFDILFQEKFIAVRHQDLYYVTATPEDALAHIEGYPLAAGKK